MQYKVNETSAQRALPSEELASAPLSKSLSLFEPQLHLLKKIYKWLKATSIIMELQQKLLGPLREICSFLQK